MTTPARSPIADAAAQALQAWETSEARQREVIAAARSKVAPLLPGVAVQSLQATLEVGNLVVITDGVVHLGVRADGTVSVVRRTGNGWTETRQVSTAVELAQALPAEVMAGRRDRG